jgi:hypothetical protein
MAVRLDIENYRAQVDALLASIRCPSPASAKAAPVHELIERLKYVLRIYEWLMQLNLHQIHRNGNAFADK